MTIIEEHYVLSFKNGEHKAYVDLAQEYGFDIVVSANLKVGLRFVHPGRHHIIQLHVDEDHDRDQQYEPHLYIYVREQGKYSAGKKYTADMLEYDTPMFPSHYTEMEWTWLTNGDPPLLEFLRRELHIWFKVRPHTMNTMKQIDTLANESP
jgi:hypothetical protein